MILKKQISIISDSTGRPYVAIDIFPYEIPTFTSQLEDFLGDQYIYFCANRQERDGGHYHVTVLLNYDKEKHKDLIGKEVSLELLGIGKAEKKNNTAYFIIVKSPELDKILFDLGETPKDFHITLGFNLKDVHGVPKDLSTKIL